jgi:hypothetical protein
VQVDLERASGSDVQLTLLSLAALGGASSSDAAQSLIAHLNRPEVNAQLSGVEKQTLQLLSMADHSRS